MRWLLVLSLIGFVDLLNAQPPKATPGNRLAYLDDLDLNPLLAQADAGGHARYCTIEGRNEVPDTLDAQMIGDARPALEGGEKMQLTYNIRNTHRAIGTRLSAEITAQRCTFAKSP